jgi:hypothetical protein
MYQYNDGSATDKNIKKIIPILVYWAMTSWDKPHYYSDLAKETGQNPQSIGPLLGYIWSRILQPELAPPLNALVRSKAKDLPSDGLDYVFPDYSDQDLEEKHKMVEKANWKAHQYNWAPLLRKLGLKPKVLLRSDVLSPSASHGKFNSSSESEAHLRLKHFILNHPNAIGVSDKVIQAQEEYMLPSLDEIDVYFETLEDIISVEVKSIISDETDIIRGVFQCVKYKALLEAQNKVVAKTKPVTSILVIKSTLSDKVAKIAKALDVDVIQIFEHCSKM